MSDESARSPSRLGIASAADRLGVHPRTLMAYERIGLVKPERQSNRRIYSEEDLCWIGCAQDLNRSAGISLHGLAMLLRFVPCWGVRDQAERGGFGENGRRGEPTPAEMLSSVQEAFAGSAPRTCQDCRRYRSRAGDAREALEKPGAQVPRRR